MLSYPDSRRRVEWDVGLVWWPVWSVWWWQCYHHFHLAPQLSSISRHWSVSQSVSQWWPASDMKFLLLTPLVVISVSGHGFLFDPPARNAMWRWEVESQSHYIYWLAPVCPRFGYTNPVNYNDNELYCGGFSVQWDQVRINDTSKKYIYMYICEVMSEMWNKTQKYFLQNKGKCGICGDSFRWI